MKKILSSRLGLQWLNESVNLEKNSENEETNKDLFVVIIFFKN